MANLTAGSHWVKAVYSGDSNYATSTSPGLTQTVNKKATTTVSSSSLDPSTVGESVTYTAKVGPAAATGTVAFEEAGTPIAGCTARSVSYGTATCTVAGLSVGGHWVKAVYSGDSSYATSTSPGLTQTVNKKATTMTVSSSLNPSIVGEGVTYTATLNTTAAAGTAAFEDGGIAIPGCNAQTVNKGSTTCTVPSYSAWSSYLITATYSGDANHLASVSPVLTQTVEPPPVAPGGPFRFFSTSSFWNEEAPANAALDPNSSSIVKAFNEQVSSEQATEGGPSIATTDYSVPLYTVPAGQPTVTVKLNHTYPPRRFSPLGTLFRCRRTLSPLPVPINISWCGSRARIGCGSSGVSKIQRTAGRRNGVARCRMSRPIRVCMVPKLGRAPKPRGGVMRLRFRLRVV